jgi:hypothetical protein
MSKRIPKFVEYNDVPRTPCPVCGEILKAFYYSATPEVLACLKCKIAWELETNIRYKTERLSKQEANEFMEWDK